MKTQSLFLAFFLVVLAFLSCEKKEEPFSKVTNTPTNDSTDVTKTPVPKIQDIVPNNGPKTTVVTITGTHFGNDASKAKVYFNNLESEIQSITNTQIITTVPPKAYTGKVTVAIGDQQADGPVFTYTVIDINVSLVAGTLAGSTDGAIADAKFNSPYNMVTDSEGSIFVADRENHKIRKITTSGEVSTFAGSGTKGDKVGSGTEAEFNYPSGITIDNLNNLYVADYGNHKIKKITPQGKVSILAGSSMGDGNGPGLTAKFKYPTGVATDKDNNVYVADQGNNKIKKVTSNGAVTTIAGSTEGDLDGEALNAKFNSPFKLTTDAEGSVYVTDYENHKIKKITSNGVVTTIAGSTKGDQDGINAQFNNPTGITIDPQGNLYVADFFNHKIKTITPNGTVTTIAGSTSGDAVGTGSTAKFNFPIGLSINANNTILIADKSNNKIKQLEQE